MLFHPGDIVEHGEEAESETFDGDGPDRTAEDGSLGIRSLKGARR